jgi:serine/threonine protein kinase/tetratricopeptide (TPR) repeat protein
MSRHEMNTASMITCAGCKHSYADSALYCPNCGTPKAREPITGDSLVGKVLGERFQVLELIGQGGSGTIYRAEHVTLRRKVAIKVLHNELSRDDLAVERFRREATTVAEIDNEHIVEIHDFGRLWDGRLYLAMELLEGETLDGVLAREKQLSVERAADILIQVGEALMEAHAIGYVHRDLRPRNIYLAVRRGKANFVKLLDFGLAKLVEGDAQAASTSLGMTFGDPRYMSPEQARGDRIDRRADIYQLGCIAYEMLTGTPPFVGTRVFDILSKQVTEIPQPLPTRRPGVPLWMEGAVTKMLAKDPDNRFATTTRMVEALRRGLETGEVMEDEIARRRESIPPPSVSRVMQKMGISGPVDSPVLGKDTLKGHLEPMPAEPRPAGMDQVVAGKATMKGHYEGPLPPLVTGAPPPTIEERRRTGTPQLGVPMLAEPAFTQKPVTGVIDPARRTESDALHPGPARRSDPEARAKTPTAPPPEALRVKSPTGPADVAPAGRRRTPSQEPNSDSAAWFEEGESASAEADQIRARKLISPSITDLSIYDETMMQRRRWPLVVGVLVVLGLGGAIAFALTRDGDAPRQTAEVTPPPPAPPTDVPPSQIITPPPTAPAVLPTAPVVAAKTQPAKTDTKQPAKTDTKTPAKTDTKRVTTKPSGTGDTSSRRPGGDWFPSTTTNPPTGPTTTVVTPPTTTPKTTGVSGVDGPQDPYGGGTDTPPDDSAGADKKAEFFANVGQQQLASGDTAGAAASFKKALELDPKHVAATIGMGEIALRQGLFGDAIAHLKKAARLAPKSSRVFTLLGEAYLNSGNNSVAAENFKKALQLDPDNSRAREGFNEASAKVPPPEDDN